MVRSVSVFNHLVPTEHFRNLFFNSVDKCRSGHASNIPFALLAHGYGSVLGLVSSHDEHVRDFVELRFADLLPNLFTAVVNEGANIALFKRF